MNEVKEDVPSKKDAAVAVSGRLERMLGLVALVLLLVGSVVLLPRVFAANGNASESAWRKLWSYTTQAQTYIDAVDSTRTLREGDAVFMSDGGSVRQVGYVSRADARDVDSMVTLCLFESQLSDVSLQWESHANEGRLDDALALMFPPEKQARVERLLREAMQQHGERLAARVFPIIERSVRESLPLIEQSFRESVTRHRAEIDALAAKWKQSLVEQRLVPLAKNELLPIVRRHAEPIATEVGHELWERASLWSFAWRGLYDQTPLPKKNLTRREWDRFVEEEAVPVLEAHVDDFARALRGIVVEVAANPSVRQEITNASDEMARDPQTRALVQTLLKEAIVDNQRLRDHWRDLWSSEEVRVVMQEEGRQLEPVIRQLGDELMGSRQTGIDPGFARLLRNQVLMKDQRWVMVSKSNKPRGQVVIERARDGAVYPQVLVASPPQPARE